MAIPSEINALIERLNQELDIIEQEATEGLNFARDILNRFPTNFNVIQLSAFLNTAIFFVGTSRGRIQIIVDNISTNDVTINEEIQQVGEDLATDLGRALETKIRVSQVKARLENLQ
jgi:predicted choloylglycine hydrolase